MKTRGLFVFAAMVAVGLLSGPVATAHDSHPRSGYTGGGGHTSGTHPLNPAHLWVILKAPSNGDVTSGGRYHDGCATDTTCGAAHGYGGVAGDWAMDIAGGTAVSLHLTYNVGGALADANQADVTIDNNRPIRIRANAWETGYYASGPDDDACLWQRFTVYVSYWGTNGQQYANDIAHFWFGHIINPEFTYGQQVNTTTSVQNPYGDGSPSSKIYYVAGRKLADVSPYTDTTGVSCSSGPHTHIETLNRHAWGRDYEWHSIKLGGGTGPYGPDDYSYYQASHVHGTDHPSHEAYPTYRPDSVTRGDTWLFRMGGGTTQFPMADNPSSPYHGMTPEAEEPDFTPAELLTQQIVEETDKVYGYLGALLGEHDFCSPGDRECEVMSGVSVIVPLLIDHCSRLDVDDIRAAKGFEGSLHEAEAAAGDAGCTVLRDATKRLGAPRDSAEWRDAMRDARAALRVAPHIASAESG